MNGTVIDNCYHWVISKKMRVMESKHGVLTVTNSAVGNTQRHNELGRTKKYLRRSTTGLRSPKSGLRSKTKLRSHKRRSKTGLRKPAYNRHKEVYDRPLWL